MEIVVTRSISHMSKPPAKALIEKGSRRVEIYDLPIEEFIQNKINDVRVDGSLFLTI